MTLSRKEELLAPKFAKMHDGFDDFYVKKDDMYLSQELAEGLHLWVQVTEGYKGLPELDRSKFKIRYGKLDVMQNLAEKLGGKVYFTSYATKHIYDEHEWK